MTLSKHLKESNICTLKELSEYTGVSTSTLYKLWKRKDERIYAYIDGYILRKKVMPFMVDVNER